MGSKKLDRRAAREGSSRGSRKGIGQLLGWLSWMGVFGLIALNILLIYREASRAGGLEAAAKLLSRTSPRRAGLVATDGERASLPYVLSWEPRIFMVPGVLSDKECDVLAAKAKPHLFRSSTYNENENTRTSKSAFLGNDSENDEFFQEIRRRLLHALQMPSWHSENLQVAHYEVGEKYSFHFDFSQPGAPRRSPHKFPGGDVLRSMTLIVYLTEGFDGGETVFPMVPAGDYDPKNCTGVGPIPREQYPIPEERHWVFPDIDPYCADDSGVLKVKPPKGSAVLFHDFTPTFQLDMATLHGACPVRKGAKTIAQQWINMNPAYVGSRLPYEAKDTL